MSSVWSIVRFKTLLHASLFLLAAGIFACGPAPAATPSTIVVDQSFADKTVQAHVGDTVRVQLQESFPVPGSSLTWAVSSSAPSVLKVGVVTRDPAERPRQGTVKYTADFTASTTGEAKLFARGSRTCEAMPSCPQQDFTVTVEVS
jgi:hypothetical protein